MQCNPTEIIYEVIQNFRFSHFQLFFFCYAQLASYYTFFVIDFLNFEIKNLFLECLHFIINHFLSKSIMSKLILQVVIALAIATCTIESLPSVQLSEACNKHELAYNFQQPIHITNEQSTWNTTQLSNRTCQLILNGTANRTIDSASTFFTIRVTLDTSVDSWSYMSIIDHDDEDHIQDGVVLNETAVSEQFKQTNSFNVESGCFEINLSDRLQSLGTVFKDIKSITITAFTNTNKSKN